jgi:hypothetical protein
MVTPRTYDAQYGFSGGDMPWITEELRGGRYYSRWIEAEFANGFRLRCNCGFAAEWQSCSEGIRLWADQIHRAH